MKPKSITQSIPSFTTKMHLVCCNDELRPTMARIHFHEGYAYATNAHALIKIPLDRFGFTTEDIAAMNGHSITVSQFKLLFNKGVKVLPGELFIVEMLVTVKMKPAEAEDNHLLSNIAKVIAEKPEGNSVTEIAINPSLIMKCHNALGGKYAAKFRFTQSNRAVFMESAECDMPGVGIVMPSMIHN